MSDKKGNIWLANCGNDTVTMIPKGRPTRAKNIALPGGRGEEGNFTPSTPSEKDQPPGPDAPLLKPFAIAIDPKGRVWVTGNQVGYEGSDAVPVGKIYRISSHGVVETLSDLDAYSNPVLSWTMGIAGDSKGSMWVSNSDSVRVPCVDDLDPQDGDGASIALYPADDSPPSVYTGGGLTIPWVMLLMGTRRCGYSILVKRLQKMSTRTLNGRTPRSLISAAWIPVNVRRV